MSANSDEMYPVLPEANTDSGPRYEYLMASLVALKFLQDSTFTEFKISTNNQKFGKFDDLIVETKSEQGVTHTWALQLKHVKPGKVLTKSELAASKEFGIQKYFTDFREKQQNYSETTLILYTSKQLDEEKQFEIPGKCSYISKTINISKPNLFDTSPNCSIYQYEINLKPGHRLDDQKEFDDYKRFFSKFYLYSSQNNVDGIQGEISKLFTDIYKSNGGDKYITIFTNWCRREAKEGVKQKLSRTNIEFELSKILLEPHVVPTARMKSNTRGELLKQAISNFNVTVLPKKCEDHVQNLWETCDSIKDWSGNELPLVVNVDATNQHSVYSAINLCPNRRIVLVGDCVDLTRLKHDVKVLQNLSNLQGEDCYKEVLENFSCVIQGRENTRLLQILNDNANLKDCFGVGELFQMVGEKPLVIGDDTAELPAYYIKRSISKQIFSLDSIKNLSNDALVIACAISDWDWIQRKIEIASNFHTKVLRNEENEFMYKVKESKLDAPLIILIEGACSSDEFNNICNHLNKEKSVHHFQIDKGNLVWIKTRGKIFQIKKFQTVVSNEKIIAPDSDFLQYPTNNLNVLAANPGMGKTVFLNFLKRNSKFTVWPVLFNLREKVSVFKRNISGRDLVKEILNLETNNGLVDRLQKIYEQNIVFLWDGLDEVESGNVKCILDGIKKISELGYSQWITSRRHLNAVLENFFGILTVSLRNITYDDKKKYMEESLGRIYDKDIDDVTSNIFEYIEKSNLKNTLGIPLMLHIFTQICLDKTNYQHILNSELTWFRIYDIFVDGKFKHYNKKVNIENNALFTAGQDFVKSVFSDFYQKAALRTCFGEALDSTFREKLDADCDKFLKSIAVNGDSYGIITKVDTNVIMFMHQTFAEYFSAVYLAENFKTVDQEILKLLFRERYKTVRRFFDMCLSQNCPAHLAVLELNVSKFQNIAQSNVNELFSKDGGGRNCLHIACSYGITRPPMMKTLSEGTSEVVFDTEPLELSAKENEEYKKIIKILMSCSRDKEEDILQNDAVFEMNCLQYADSSMVLFPMIEILATLPQLLEESRKLFDSFHNYKDIGSFIAYSIVFNYENFISKLKHIPYFECKKNCDDSRNFFHFKYGGENCNSPMLMIHYGRLHMLKKALQNRSNARKVNILFNKKQTLLSWAIVLEKWDMVEVLTEHNVETAEHYSVWESDVAHITCSRNSIESIKSLRQENLINFEIGVNEGRNPLILAAEFLNFEIVRCLIDKGANIYAIRSHDRSNILHFACKSKRNTDFIRSLSKENIQNLDNGDIYGITPLMVAAKFGNIEIFKFLIDNGANMNAKSIDRSNSLHFNCRRKNNTAFMKGLTTEILLNFDNGDKHGRTPTMVAAKSANFEIVKYLIDHGANINAKSIDGSNILHFALKRKAKIDFVKCLTKENLLKLDTSDSYGRTPLLLAAELDDFEIVKYLIDNGANMYAKSNIGSNFLHSVCLHEMVGFLKSLTKENLLNLDNSDRQGRTPMLLAAEFSNFKMVKYLIDNGANMYAKNSNGSNVLHLACEKTLFEFIQTLTRENLTVLDESDYLGNTPLLIAARSGNFEIFQYLLNKGANVNAWNSNGCNILHLAYDRGHLSFIKKLSENLLSENVFDALLKEVDRTGKTPIDFKYK